jgi:hypothetical protein
MRALAGESGPKSSDSFPEVIDTFRCLIHDGLN